MVQRIMKEQEFESDVFDRKTWSKVFQLLWEHKKTVIPLIFFNTVLALTDVIMPLLNRYALNTYVDDQTGAQTLPVFIGVYLAMIVAQCLLVYLFFRLAARVESDFGKNLRKKCFRKLQEQTFSYFDRTANGWLMARITSDTARLAETLAWAFVDVVWGIFVMLGISIVMLLVNWQMALCVLVVVPLLWFVSLYFQRRILSAQRKSRKANSRITASFAEGINGAKTTKTLGIEQQNYEEFQKKTEDMKRYSMRALHINAIFQPIVYLLSAVVIALLLYVGGEQVLLKTIQFGTLAMFINYAQLFFDPLKQIARVLAEIQMAQASAERVVALLDEEIEIVDRPDVIERYGTLLDEHTEAYEFLHGDVVFDHVDFYYYENEPVLRDFCLRVSQGQTVALVGETGSGKSTIVNLLCRFYEPCRGKIIMDGRDLRDRSVGWLHSHIGYVLQTPNLFSGTIRDNIRYGRADATDEEVEHVARLIQAHDFISRMEKGYDSEVGEGGDRLSTGQKQLISFARAMLSNPAIVILDEATSSIDTESEKAIQYAMSKLLHGRTSFVVAHRLSTIVDADIIVVLQHGVIMEQGTHEELMAAKGYYYELFTSQYRQEQHAAAWK
ncbi:ABC transporter ATP-binding protein/permease [[Clostridium] innocuum]|nr:ABC transporter ATP-binding protein/permease [[Clostridium] innocuum]